MPLPPMYFPVYNLHFRLPEPGLHAQPMIGTPPMMHVEGLHTVQWIASDQTKLTATTQGDMQRLCLKNYDTGMLIPHIPAPPMLGPFLADTLLNSQYLVPFNQPDVVLEGQPVGVFFWGVSPTWRCYEIKLPFPPIIGKKLQALGKAGAARRAAHQAQKAQEQIEKSLDAIDELQETAESMLSQDKLSPEAAAKNEKKQAEEQAKIDKAVKDQSKAADKQQAADKWADDVDAENEAAKNAPAEDPLERDQRALESDLDSSAAREEEKAALTEKKEADKRARNANREADKQDAKVKANLSRDGGSAEAVVVHQEAADKKRAEAKQAESESKAAQDKAKKAAKAGGDARKKKSVEDRRRELAKEHKEKYPKSNPYKDATGFGNVVIAWPSLLCHIPFPCTIQIYMSLVTLALNALNAAVGAAAALVNAYIGFVFDSLGAGRGGLATWGMNLLKAVSTGAVNSAKDYFTEGKVNFKVSTKSGVVETSAELSQDPKTKEWSWKASGEAGGKGSLGAGKISASGEGKLKESADPNAVLPDATLEGKSGSVSAKPGTKPWAPSVGYEYSEKHVPEKTDASGNVISPAKNVESDSYSASLKRGKVSYTDETTTSADGSSSEVVKESGALPGSSASHATTTARAADGTTKVTTTDTANTPVAQYQNTTQSAPTQTRNPAIVDYTGGAGAVGGA